MQYIRKLLIILLAVFTLTGCTKNQSVQQLTVSSSSSSQTALRTATPDPDDEISEEGTYDSKEEVALYLHLYGHLPANFMTKDEASAKGWKGGALSTVIEGMAIGGDTFEDESGLLPEVKGRTYYVCDINTVGKQKRGQERMVWSDDGNIYYTPDFYETYEHLYGDDDVPDVLTADSVSSTEEEEETLPEDGTYDSKEEVALYLHLYGHLPSNYMTKSQARKKGWSGGALSTVVKGMSIGGDVYGNYEGVLPKVNGRTYYECDIDTTGKSKRGSKRIIWSDDGNIYYTEDHYETFEHLYGDDDYE